MMTADATKFACEFISKVKIYLTQQKYVVEPCLDEIYYYFSKYKLSTSLVDCLEYEDECDLANAAKSLPTFIDDNCLNIKSCGELLDINISQSSQICSYTIGLVNSNGVTTAFPEIRLENNLVYQNAYVTVKATSCNEEYTYEASTGCVGAGTPSCSSDYDVFGTFHYTLKGLQNNSSGYIKTIRIYETNDDGILNPSYIDVDVSPSNIAAWTSCPLCSGVTPSNLYFASSNWENAFNVLLDNVAYTLHGALNADWNVDFTLLGVNAGIRINNRVKHNPTSKWMGINKYDFKVTWVNNLGKVITILKPSITFSSSNAFMSSDFSFTTPCGDITGKVFTLGAAPDTNGTQSNFNFLKLNDTKLESPAMLANVIYPNDCAKTVLTASYITGESVTVVEWLDPNGDFISNDLSITVTTPGVYSFRVELDNGCSGVGYANVTDSIDYVALVTENDDFITTENNIILIA